MKNDPRYYTALIVFIIGLMINLYINLLPNKFALMGAIILETIVLFFVGLILLIFKNTQQVAQGIFIGLGLNLIIGFSVCTML